MSEQVLHEWRFAGYVVRIVETEPGIVHFEQAQGPPIGQDASGPLAFNRTEKPLGDANEIIHLSQALAEANIINRDLSAAIQRWQEERNRLERELAAARAVIRMTTWESIAGACRRHGQEPEPKWRDFTDFGYYLVDPDTEEYIEVPIEGEHEATVRAAYAGMPHITAVDDARTRVSELEAENARLWKCVEAADSEIEAWREWGACIGGDERVCGWVHQEDYGLYCLLSDPPVSDIPYDRARAEVDK